MKHAISSVEVLDWLHAHHPKLHADAEIDRAWVWLSTNLSGESNKPIRDELKAIGFRFAKKDHPLPSGKTGRWGHSCNKPMPFHRKGGKSSTHTKSNRDSLEPQAPAISADDLAFLQSL